VERWKGDVKNRAKDGSYYWILFDNCSILDSKGNPNQYIAISSDVTEQKIATENLDEALVSLEKNNKELDQFVYHITRPQGATESNS
jgi:hypothetical protein